MCYIFTILFYIVICMNQLNKREINRILQSNNHYEVLGINPNASKQEIKQAFRNNALKYHPDKNNLPEAKELFHKVTNAYEHLSDDNKKTFFDRNNRQDKKENNTFKTERKDRPAGTAPRGPQRQDKPKPPPQATWQRANKPDYSKYFNPPKNPYNPKRPEPEPQVRSNSPFEDASERKRQSYKLKTQKTSWLGVFFTLFMFFMFWTLVPDFTSRRQQRGPSFLLTKTEQYSLRVKTSKYKFPYFIKPQHLNATVTMDSRVEEVTLKKLESDCQQALNLKQKYDHLIITDKVNLVFWQQQRSDINFKPCKKILKLIKKYPEIKLTRFKHLNK